MNTILYCILYLQILIKISQIKIMNIKTKLDINYKR